MGEGTLIWFWGDIDTEPLKVILSGYKPSILKKNNVKQKYQKEKPDKNVNVDNLIKIPRKRHSRRLSDSAPINVPFVEFKADCHTSQKTNNPCFSKVWAAKSPNTIVLQGYYKHTIKNSKTIVCMKFFMKTVKPTRCFQCFPNSEQTILSIVKNLKTENLLEWF